MSEKIVGLIAVRAGSKRITNKNIRPFADSSLLKIKIQQAINSCHLDRVYVSSDSEEMLSIANQLGAIPLLRSHELASDGIPMNVVYESLAGAITEKHVCFLHVTSPILSNSSLTQCIEKYRSEIIDSKKYDSLASVHRIQEYLWHNGAPINYDPQNHPRSQDLPNYYALNFAVNILPREIMILKKNIVGDEFYPFFLSAEESIDVDTLHDFQYAEWVYKNKNNDICQFNFNEEI